MNSLVEAFFTNKKLEVKNRLRAQLDTVVDDLFVELATTVKQLFIPSPTQAGSINQNSVDAESRNETVTKKTSFDEKGFAIKRKMTSLDAGGEKRARYSPTSSPGGMSLQPSDPIRSSTMIDSDGEETSKKLQIKSDANSQIQASVKKKRNPKFACSQPDCTRSFTSHNDLKRHERFHLGVKPFHCKWPDCVYASQDRANVLRHIQSQQFKKNRFKYGQANDEAKPEEEEDAKLYLRIEADLLN